MRRQLGQSMAEYLVVLGVSGSIIAALTLTPCEVANSSKGCIPTMLDALHNNYSGYSAAMSAVQNYGDVEVAAPPADDTDGGNDDDDDQMTGDEDAPDTPEVNALGKVNEIYDSNGNLLGTVQGDKIYNTDGEVIGEYNFNPETGEQTAVIDGQQITGVNVVSTVIGKDGTPVKLKAFVLNGQVIGFGYTDDGKFYDAVNADETNKVPPGAQVVDIRKVKVRDNQGKLNDFGYEYAGFVYSLAKVQVFNDSYNAPKVPDGELVEMRLSELATNTSWAGYSKCIVRGVDWVNKELSGYPGSGDYQFDKLSGGTTTTNNAVVESPTNNLGFIDSADIGAGGCQGRWALQEAADTWTLSGPL